MCTFILNICVETCFINIKIKPLNVMQEEITISFWYHANSWDALIKKNSTTFKWEINYYITPQLPRTTSIIQEGPLETLEKQSRPLLFKKERKSEEEKGEEEKGDEIFSRVLMFS